MLRPLPVLRHILLQKPQIALYLPANDSRRIPRMIQAEPSIGKSQPQLSIDPRDILVDPAPIP